LLSRLSSILLVVWVVVLCGFASAQATPAQGTGSATGISAIQHVIIIFQENRTTDNLFHGLKGADTADYGYNSKGQKITLGPMKLASNYSLDHYHPDFVWMYDHGKMDGADLIPGDCGTKCPANMQFKYVPRSDVEPYFQMAEQYAFGDRMFQSNQGPSYPAHQFIIGATSAPSPTSDLFDGEDTFGISQPAGHSGCGAPAQIHTTLIDPLGQEKLLAFPCFDHLTLMDLLDNKGLSWRYYTLSTTYIWTGPNAISHIYNGPDWAYVIPTPSQVLKDIAGGHLANVSWVIPEGVSSDHPHANNGSGPSWVASIVNAVGNSQYWNSTAIFVTWDDWGGWFDHVPPPIRNSYEYSFRVPLLVISPYAKPGYVSHFNHDFSSIIKFTETAFGLPSLGFGDVYSDDLTDCFNFSQKPLTFHTIKAPLKAEYFLNHHFPKSEPDDD
jgi:phospholipase C